MSGLVILRILTLCGWIASVAALSQLVAGRGRRLSPDVRGAWRVELGRHAAIGATTLLIEVAWFVKAIAPESVWTVIGKALYNPAFLFNGTVDAVAPVLVIGYLVGAGRLRRAFVVVAGGVGATGVVAGVLGAVHDWGALMSASQLLTFFALGGYLTFFILVATGRLPAADAYLIGMMAVAGLFYLVLPIQTAFFQLVGREASQRIWLLNQLLQAGMVAAELAITLALINALSRGREPRPTLATA